MAGRPAPRQCAKVQIETGFDMEMEIAWFEGVDEKGRTALHLAVESGQAETVRGFLEKGARVDDIGDVYRFCPPLVLALRLVDPEIAQMLLDAGADIHEGDYDGQTPLHEASAGGHVDTVRELLDRGAALEALNDRGEPPLHRASAGSNVDTVRELLDRGAALEARDLHGETPLHKASTGCHIGELQELLDRGAELDARNRMGATPLHFAACRGDYKLETARVLLGRGAEIDSVSLAGDTPFDTRFDEVRKVLRMEYVARAARRMHLEAEVAALEAETRVVAPIGQRSRGSARRM